MHQIEIAARECTYQNGCLQHSAGQRKLCGMNPLSSEPTNYCPYLSGLAITVPRQDGQDTWWKAEAQVWHGCVYKRK